jgi:hypothetical protein
MSTAPGPEHSTPSRRALALLVIVSAQLPAVGKDARVAELALLAASAFFLAVGFCGTLSVTIVPVGVSVIHAGVLSTYMTPVRRRLAQDYAEVVVETERTVNTMLTVLREAALYLTFGAALDGILWLVRHV